MRAQHACIVDALSGERLDVLKQTVPLEMQLGQDAQSSNLGDAKDVDALASWLQAIHAARVLGNGSNKACVVLTGPPAAGKTCLMSHRSSTSSSLSASCRCIWCLRPSAALAPPPLCPPPSDG